jgi:hypothetical protein
MPKVEKIYMSNFKSKEKKSIGAQFMEFFFLIIVPFILIVGGLFIYYLFNQSHTQKSHLSSSISESISNVKNCTCTEWIQKNCGEGNCKWNERLELRNCMPVGCKSETRCVEDESCKKLSLSEKGEETKTSGTQNFRKTQEGPSKSYLVNKEDNEKLFFPPEVVESNQAQELKEEEAKICTCEEWKNMGCGEENCSFDEMYQKRFCLPAGCNEESQCVKDEDCVRPINEEIKAGNWKWKVIKVRNRGSILRGSESNYPWIKDKITEGKFIEVEMLVQNTGQETLYYYSYPSIYDNKKREYRAAIVETSDWIPEDKKCGLKQVKPGFSPLDCVEIYEVAKDSTDLWLYVPSTDWSEKGKFIYLGSF